MPPCSIFQPDTGNRHLARLEEKYFSHMNQFNYVDTKTFINAINTQLATYRPLFEKYAGKMDWQVLAAIARQESHWNPTATSPTGVRGIMMLTRPTADFFGIEDRLDGAEHQGRRDIYKLPDGQTAGFHPR